MRPTVRLDNKMAVPVKTFIFFVCVTLVILMLTLNALTHLITLLLYSGHQCMHCMVLLCVQYKVKLSSFLSWFAKEANVANND